MGRVARLIAISTVSVATSCALFTDLGGLSGTESFPSPEASTADAPIVGDAADTGAPGPSADAGVTGCASFFCEDFDDDAALSRIESRIVDVYEPRPMIEINSETSTSAPRAFVAFASPVHSGARAHFARTLVVDDAPGLRCSFDLRLDDLPSDGRYLAVAVSAVDAPEHRAGVLELSAGGATAIFDDEVLGGAWLDGPTLSLRQWRRYTVTLQRRPIASFTITDGSETFTIPLATWPMTPKLALWLGLVYSTPYGTAGPFRIRLDTIRCDKL